MKANRPIRKKKLAVKRLPREDVVTSVSLVSGRERMWQFHYERLEQSRKQTRDAKREIKKLKKKVDSLHATIGFLLTQ
jgi:hypothetical protein